MASPFLLGIAAAAAAAPPRRPHVLFILADDFGWNDVGYHQNNVSSANPKGYPTTNAAAGIMPTPIIDSLASEGVKLENYYVQPLCSPTRSALLTGRYPQHTGIGPDVIVINWPYGVPARETLLPERMKEAGYKTHMIGKWHLGACDERYLPTYRGFDSFLGYLSGAQSYYASAGDRNGTGANILPTCVGDSADHLYSSTFFASEASQIVRNHQKHTNGEGTDPAPLFLYLAMQNVHNPYEPPPDTIVNVNKTFPEIVDMERRIYAGMVKALDLAVGDVVSVFKEEGLWEDTVLIFSTDNGGIGAGNNYPLRGIKETLWEGGIRGVGFVRGTDSDIAPLPKGQTSDILMHVTDWYPTILGLAGANASDKQLPLDGFDQWEALQRNSRDGPRKVIYHNVVPTGLEIVNRGNATHPEYTSNTCMKRVDPRVNSCHAYGATGAAIRVGDIKLLVTHNGSAPWGDSVPQYPQFTPGGKYPNGSHVFQPVTHDTTPSPFQGVYYLFNMSTDPTESVNLAKTRPDLLNKMIKILKEYEDADDTIIGLSYYYGFPDPKSADNPGGCEGPFIGSHYCAYGNEFACIIKGEILKGTDTITTTHTDSAAQCQGRCDDTDGCGWWSYQESSANRCSLFSSTGSPAECEASDDCAWGKREGCAVSLSSVDDLAVR